jgi:YVTN family beta-propeller protein
VKVIRLPAGAKPVGVAVSPDGGRIFVSGGAAGMVFAIDALTGEVTAQARVGERPWGVALLPDGSRLFTANGVSNDVSVVDVATFQEVARIPVGKAPWGVAVSVPPSAADH